MYPCCRWPCASPSSSPSSPAPCCASPGWCLAAVSRSAPCCRPRRRCCCCASAVAATCLCLAGLPPSPLLPRPLPPTSCSPCRSWSTRRCTAAGAPFTPAPPSAAAAAPSFPADPGCLVRWSQGRCADQGAALPAAGAGGLKLLAGLALRTASCSSALQAGQAGHVSLTQEQGQARPPAGLKRPLFWQQKVAPAAASNLPPLQLPSSPLLACSCGWGAAAASCPAAAPLPAPPPRSPCLLPLLAQTAGSGSARAAAPPLARAISRAPRLGWGCQTWACTSVGWGEVEWGWGGQVQVPWA